MSPPGADPTGPSHESLSEEFLPPETLIRWRVVAHQGHPLRSFLADVLPHWVGESMETEIEVEKRARGTLAASVLSVAGPLATLIVWLAVWLLLGFGSLWSIGTLLGHPVWWIILTVGGAAFFTVLALRLVLKLFLEKSELRRSDGISFVRLNAGLALPLLMYTVSSPSLPLFTVVGSEGLPTFGAWSGFYGFMFGNLLTFGALEALLGEPGVLQPASTWAASGTLWIHLLMLTSVIAPVVETLVERMTNVREFTCTLGVLSTTLKELGFGDGRRAVVTAIGRETPLPATAGRSLKDLRELGKWRLHQDGTLVPLRMERRMSRRTTLNRRLLKNWLKIPLMLVSMTWYFVVTGAWLTVLSAPITYLISRYTSLSLANSWAVALGGTLLSFVVVWDLTERRKKLKKGSIESPPRARPIEWLRRAVNAGWRIQSRVQRADPAKKMLKRLERERLFISLPAGGGEDALRMFETAQQKAPGVVEIWSDSNRCSLASPLVGRWKSDTRRAIGTSERLVVICGPDTDEDPRQNAELRIAIDQGIPYLLIASDDSARRPEGVATFERLLPLSLETLHKTVYRYKLRGTALDAMAEIMAAAAEDQ